MGRSPFINLETTINTLRVSALARKVDDLMLNLEYGSDVEKDQILEALREVRADLRKIAYNY